MQRCLLWSLPLVAVRQKHDILTCPLVALLLLQMAAAPHTFVTPRYCIHHHTEHTVARIHGAYLIKMENDDGGGSEQPNEEDSPVVVRPWDDSNYNDLLASLRDGRDVLEVRFRAVLVFILDGIDEVCLALPSARSIKEVDLGTFHMIEWQKGEITAEHASVWDKLFLTLSNLGTVDTLSLVTFVLLAKFWVVLSCLCPM